MTIHEPNKLPKRRLGFRMEEEEYPEYETERSAETISVVTPRDVEPLASLESLSPDETKELLGKMIAERANSKAIEESLKKMIDGSLNILDNNELSTKDKLKLLEKNRELMITVQGGTPYRFGSEKVIYSILAFSALILIILASLTAFYELPQEVTITFVGTVLGGTIATIAQKLGKVG